MPADEKVWAVSGKAVVTSCHASFFCQSRKGMSPGESGRSRALVILPSCLLSLSSVAVGRDEGHVWPFTAGSELSGGHGVLGTCRSSSRALPL